MKRFLERGERRNLSISFGSQKVPGNFGRKKAAGDGTSGQRFTDLSTKMQTQIEITFRVGNLPQHTTNNLLKRLASYRWKLPPFGSLTDAYIQGIEPITGKKRGVLRFTGVRNRFEMVSALQKAHIGASIISCEFGKDRLVPLDMRLRMISSARRKVTAAPVQPQTHKRKTVLPGPSKPAQTWVKVLQKNDTHFEGSRANGKKMVRASQALARAKSVVIKNQADNTEWLSRSAVGFLRHLEVMPDVKRIISEVGWNCNVKIMGKNMFLLEFSSVVEMTRRLDEKNHLIGGLFISLLPWSEKLGAGGRVVWVQMSGIPLNTWGQETFEKLASPFGSLVTIDDATSSKQRIDVARILLATDSLAIKGPIQAKLNGKTLQVWVQEEPWFITDIQSGWKLGYDDEEEGFEESVSSEFGKEERERTEIDKIFEGQLNKKPRWNSDEGFVSSMPPPPFNFPGNRNNRNSTSKETVVENSFISPRHIDGPSDSLVSTSMIHARKGSGTKGVDREPGEIVEGMWPVGQKLGYAAEASQEMLTAFAKSKESAEV